MVTVNVTPALAQTDSIKVEIDGLPVSFDSEPRLEQGRLLVPFRAIAEALNIYVAWDEANQLITAQKDGTLIQMGVGNPQALVNGEVYWLDVPPAIYNGRVLVPARFLSESLNSQVQWDEKSRRVSIVSPPKIMKLLAYYALGDEQTSSWTDLFGVAYPQTDFGHTGVVSHLALGWYSLDAQGNLLTDDPSGWRRPLGWEDVLEAAQDYKLETQMLVFATDEGGRLRQLFNDEEAAERAIKSIIKEARHYQGVNLDFEGLGWNDDPQQLAEVKRAYNNFARELAQGLHKGNQELTLTLHAPNSAYLGYDYKSLGRIADHVVIMAYDYGSKPEPNSMVQQAVEMALQEVPAGKLLLGVSAPHESASSIISKIGMAKRYNLEGIALWRLGLVSEEMWTSLVSNIQKSL